MAADRVRLAVVRLTDCAPVALALHDGLFAAQGLDVEVAVEPSWANVADKLAWGVVDGAVMLLPLAAAMELGLRPPATPLVAPACISRNGNAVTLARRLADPILQGGRPAPARAAARLAALRPGRLRLGVVHAFSTHDLLLRLWLEQAGIDPATAAEIVAVPPQDAAHALAAGLIDGFCAGAPWGAVAAARGAGRTVAVTSAIAPGHPEKALVLRRGWAEANPRATRALRAALALAAAACNRPGETDRIASVLAAPQWLDLPATLIAASLPGGPDGPDGEVDRPSFGAEPVPAEDAAWLLRRMSRHRAMPPDAPLRLQAMFHVPAPAR